MEPITESWAGQFCGALNKDQRKKIARALGELVLTSDGVERIMEVFTQQMDLAYSTDQTKRQQSDLLMENTHIRFLMDGTESGEYLGLDLGGTNFRVLLIKLTNGEAEPLKENYAIPQDILCGPAKGVFDFVAARILDFETKYGLGNRQDPFPLGFTFSFPSRQLALNSCTLVTWTKSYRCPDGVGMDPVKMLEEALDRHGLGKKVNVVAVINDTTGSLMAGNYMDKKALIAVGLGSNAAFVEDIDRIKRWTGDRKDPKQVIVNMEWGAAGDNGCLDFYRTEYEKDIDCRSNHVGSYTFEKSFSGLYLGELVRLVLVRLVEQGALFAGNIPPGLAQPWGFTTTHVTNIESDTGDDATNTLEVLKQLKVDPAAITANDVAVIREVTAFISQRAAYIVAAATAAVVNHTGLREVTIAMDGSLYKCHPKFHDHIMYIITRFCPSSKVKLMAVKDGSGLGAAFAAVVALKQMAAGLRCT